MKAATRREVSRKYKLVDRLSDCVFQGRPSFSWSYVVTNAIMVSDKRSFSVDTVLQRRSGKCNSFERVTAGSRWPD